MVKKDTLRSRNRKFRRNYAKVVTKLVRVLRLKRDNKDRLFVKFFSDKRELLDLCNTLNGSDYNDPNMPIRGLEYFADIYRAYIVSNELNIYETAADMAVEYCIEQDILKKYFLKHRSEVVHMFPADYDMRIYKRILKKDYERRLEEKDAEIARLMKENAKLKK